MNIKFLIPILLASLALPSAAMAQCVLDASPTPTEECDDGDGGGDGCNNMCEIEVGWSCARPLNFGTFVISDFAGVDSAAWTIDPSNIEAIQNTNTKSPTLASWGLDAFIGTYSAIIEVQTTNDDDMIGLGLGFNPGDEVGNAGRWLMIDWKQLDQGSVLAGMALSYVKGAPNNGSSVGSHSFPNRECPDPNNSCVTELTRARTLGTTGWTDNFEHEFNVVYRPDRLVVIVDGVLEFDVTPADFPAGTFDGDVFPGGDFAAYQISQNATRVESAVGLGASTCNKIDANDTTVNVLFGAGTVAVDTDNLIVDANDNVLPGSLAIVGAPADGTTTINNGVISFTPDDDTVPGTYVIEYTVCDDHPVAPDCDNGTITIVVGFPNTDNDGVNDDVDLDDDNDGILDTDEGDGSVDTDGDDVPDSLDLDSDNDGIYDIVESGLESGDSDFDATLDCPGGFGANGLCDAIETAADSGLPDYNNDQTTDVPNDTDMDGVPDFQDLDSDNDGIYDVIEGGSGCNLSNNDSQCRNVDNDDDGIVNSLDDGNTFGDGDGYQAPTDIDNDGGYDFTSLDSDDDGINDVIEGPADCDDTDDNGICDGVDGNSDGLIDGVRADEVVDTDDDGLPDFQDLDSDGDGIPDSNEGTVDTDDDGVPDYLDLDSDNDGILDLIEGASGCLDTTPADGVCDGPDADGDGLADDASGTPPDTDGDSVPDYQDLDSDNDGIPDLVEGGSECSDTTPNDGVCDGPDVDGDGVANDIDPINGHGATPTTPPNSDGNGPADYIDLDSDDDGVFDIVEGGSGCTDVNTNAVCDGPDNDGDGIPDSIDDLDGFGDTTPTVPTDSGGNSDPDYTVLDSNGDGTPDIIEVGASECENSNPVDDVCDGPDTDGDGIVDDLDTNPGFGTGAPDLDGDGVSDEDDLDDDNDGILDTVEGDGSVDTDGDGVPDSLDLDSDNDGIPDVIEGNSGCADVSIADSVCDGPDMDGDGVADDATNPTPPDTDGDGVDDFRDLDSDNDGISDVIEGGSGCDDVAPADAVCDGPDDDGDGIPDSIDTLGGHGGDPGTPLNSDQDPTPDYLDLDSDNDGIVDMIEGGSGCSDADENSVCDGPDSDGDGIPDDIDDLDGFGDSSPTVPINSDDDLWPDFIDIDSDDDGTSDVVGSNCENSNPADEVCDLPDTDGDGIVDSIDNGGNFGSGPDIDTDGDGVANQDDLDDDNDGILDTDEGGPSLDTDGDGVPDALDLDSDDDGILDAVEAGHGEPSTDGVLTCSGGFGVNGVCDAVELSPDSGTTNAPANSDDDATPDFQDSDSDNDGTSDLIEGGSGCTNVNPADDKCDGPDADGDGVVDNIDSVPGHGGGSATTPIDSDGDGTPDYADADSVPASGGDVLLTGGIGGQCSTFATPADLGWLALLLGFGIFGRRRRR